MMLRHRLARALFALSVAGALATATSAAVAADWPDTLSGRLQQIKATRLVKLGYREHAIPFSYLGPESRPVGYTLDLCAAVVATLADDLNVPLAIEYVPVTAQDRIERVASGSVDLECGATTNTAERRQRVAFSPVIFVTGTRLTVSRSSAVRNVDDLRGRPVAVVGGTTNDVAMREFDRLRGLAMKFVVADDYRDALALVADGKVAALAADDVLVRGLLAESGRAREFRVVGDMLSFEPYGIMFPRNEPSLVDAVERTLRTLAESREIVWIYERWFVRPLPSGLQLDLPMSLQLRRFFELIGLPAD